MGAIVVTHYVKLLEEIQPDRVHVLIDGRIERSGDASLAQDIELAGYDQLRPSAV
jgi:Fe-S cluster assembly ATP-binding protein